MEVRDQCGRCAAAKTDCVPVVYLERHDNGMTARRERRPLCPDCRESLFVRYNLAQYGDLGGYVEGWFVPTIIESLECDSP